MWWTRINATLHASAAAVHDPLNDDERKLFTSVQHQANRWTF